MDALTRLSGDAQTFVEKVWARAVSVHRGGADAFGDLLDVEDVDTLLTTHALRTPAVRLARDGAVLASSGYTRDARIGGVSVGGLVDAGKVLDLFSAGATVIFQALHRYWHPLAALVGELEQQLGHPCQANAYLTPGGAQGFARHRDTHDVFVLQTHGDKLWEVVEESRSREVLMQPGMAMYLPTGIPHSARAQSGASLHVTVGINPVTWRSVLQRAVADLLTAGADEPLPAGYHREPAEFGRAVDRRLADLCERLAGLEPETIVTSEVARFQTSREPLLRGGLRDRVDLPALEDATLLRRRPGAVIELVPAADRLRVLLGDREMRVPARLHSALAYVAEHDELRPSDLAAVLDQQSRLVLVRRLVREGLLEVAR